MRCFGIRWYGYHFKRRVMNENPLNQPLHKFSIKGSTCQSGLHKLNLGLAKHKHFHVHTRISQNSSSSPLGTAGQHIKYLIKEVGIAKYFGSTGQMLAS